MTLDGIDQPWIFTSPVRNRGYLWIPPCRSSPKCRLWNRIDSLAEHRAAVATIQASELLGDGTSEAGPHFERCRSGTTTADGFFLTCYVFAFVTMVEVTVVHITYRNERRKLTAKIRRTARWLVPTAFVVTNSIVIVHFLA